MRMHSTASVRRHGRTPSQALRAACMSQFAALMHPIANTDKAQSTQVPGQAPETRSATQLNACKMSALRAALAASLNCSPMIKGKSVASTAKLAMLTTSKVSVSKVMQKCQLPGTEMSTSQSAYLFT